MYGQRAKYVSSSNGLERVDTDLDREILEYVGHVGALSCVSTAARRECLILKEGELCCPVNPYAKIMKQKEKLTNQARINVLCDHLANDTAEEGIRHNNETPWMPPELQPPFPGSKAKSWQAHL